MVSRMLPTIQECGLEFVVDLVKIGLLCIFQMFFKHKFPIEVQKWIVGKRIPKDEESLQRLRVTNDQTVYLYLVTAKSVGLDKQQHMATSG